MDDLIRYLVASFVALALLTWIVDEYLWSLEREVYQGIRYTLAATSLIVGALIVYRSKRKLLSAMLIALGLALGQLWLLKYCLEILAWSIHGFAP